MLGSLQGQFQTTQQQLSQVLQNQGGTQQQAQQEQEPAREEFPPAPGKPKKLPIDIDKAEKKHHLRDRAMEWDLAIRLAIVYGLRPIEVSYDYLEVKKNGKDYLFCNYCKKAGAGITKPRRLWPLDPEWEKEWKLIERIKRKDPLPRMKAGAGDAFKITYALTKFGKG